jgi:hypothetical protein
MKSRGAYDMIAATSSAGRISSEVTPAFCGTEESFGWPGAAFRIKSTREEKRE